MQGKKGDRVAVALSGGVDSAAVAALLLEQGFEVIGLTLLLCPSSLQPGSLQPSSLCPGEGGESSGAQDACLTAQALGIEHRVLDMRERFLETVIKPFAAGYAAGQTPNPCARCNRFIKFDGLVEVAKELGAQRLATGHYARIVRDPCGPALCRALDLQRDQSYFLFATTQSMLPFLEFPLGVLDKAQARAIAARHGLKIAEKPDSQDICFVPEGDYAAIVRHYHPQAFEPGEVVDAQGRVVGRHDGIAHFTVGQRRGLRLGRREGTANEPLFVLRIDPGQRRVVVGPRQALMARGVVAREVNWLGQTIPDTGLDVQVKLRSTQQPVAARWFAKDLHEDARIELQSPLLGVAPGQAVVAYAQDRVLGGGWVVDALS